MSSSDENQLERLFSYKLPISVATHRTDDKLGVSARVFRVGNMRDEDRTSKW
ncbi:MAG: hypothetical protein KatS3mg105_5134 [Gemmatales bacterium]|nr:MAG: hypothetical protein KatS3mg105_5134 [Gemmatales bacterium]